MPSEIPTETILAAYRKAKQKLFPDEAKARGIKIDEVTTAGFIDFNISSFRQYLALREDFPYRATWKILDEPCSISVESLGVVFKTGIIPSRLEEWKKRESWSAEEFSDELAHFIAFCEDCFTLSGAFSDASVTDRMQLALYVEMAFQLGIEKEVADKVIKRFKEKDIKWQQGLPPLPGQAVSRLDAQKNRKSEQGL